MSTAWMEAVKNQAQAAPIRLAKPIIVEPEPEESTFFINHPLVPVVVIGAIALVMSTLAIGAFVALLALRYSGVMVS